METVFNPFPPQHYTAAHPPTTKIFGTINNKMPALEGGEPCVTCSLLYFVTLSGPPPQSFSPVIPTYLFQSPTILSPTM